MLYLTNCLSNSTSVYLGAYDEEEAAARGYDLAALKYWGPAAFTNFPVCPKLNECNAVKRFPRMNK